MSEREREREREGLIYCECGTEVESKLVCVSVVCEVRPQGREDDGEGHVAEEGQVVHTVHTHSRDGRGGARHALQRERESQREEREREREREVREESLRDPSEGG